tara:strand:+ start:2332 stop:3027 length:696 start_codon:yes stop_codon:yes gene_type:complete
MDHNNTVDGGQPAETTDAQVTTEVQAKEAQAEEKFYSQKEFDDAMAKMRHATLNKALKPYQDLGDPDELRQLKSSAEKARTEEQMQKGEFEKVLQDMAAKKDAEIHKKDEVIRQYKVDTPLLNSAAKNRSINPEQVSSLLKPQLRLGEDGAVEVVDSNGQVRYNDSGVALGVDDLVNEFLNANPHFVSPTPSTTNTKSNVFNDTKELDVSKLDMSNPEHRKIYAEHRKQAI